MPFVTSQKVSAIAKRRRKPALELKTSESSSREPSFIYSGNQEADVHSKI